MAGCRKLSTGGRALIFNDDEVAALLKGELNVRALNPLFARGHGVNRSNMNQFLKGKKGLSPKIVRVLKLRQVYIADR